MCRLALLVLGLVAVFSTALTAGCRRASDSWDAGVCQPRACSVLGKNCGPVDDGCGHPLACGTCTEAEVCGGSGTLNVCGAPKGSARVVAVGDIACGPDQSDFQGGSGTANACHMRATALLTQARDPAAVLLLGDIQYPEGTLDDFRRAFDPLWGGLKSRIKPTPGNHEYRTPDAAGYFDYFGSAAGERGAGFYAFDLGAWHFISLNSNCREAGGCGPGSRQLKWLEDDLVEHPHGCVLAFWHHPRFSSGKHGDDPSLQPLWKALVEARVDVALTGHDHDYERFVPLDAWGVATSEALGLREFVVGTGGKSLYPESRHRPIQAASWVDGYGVLELNLRPGSYDWRFLGEVGNFFSDTGSARCHHD